MVKSTPRKVYILENGSYTELSYEGFCHHKKTDRTYSDKLFIPVQHCLIETDREHYIEFYHDKERWRYLRKLDAAHGLLSAEELERDDSVGFIADNAVDVAGAVVHKMMLDKLVSSLTLLSEDEQTLIRQHFFENKSQVELSYIYGIDQSTVSRHIGKILRKLKKLLES